MAQMKLTTRFLLSAIVVICVATAFFHGCHQKPKKGVNETAVRDVMVRDATVWTNPFSKTSPIYREAEEFHQWLLDNRTLADEVDAAGSVDKLMLAGQLATKGLARLPTDLLEQRLPLVGRMLASLDTHTCSRFIRGEIPDSEFISYAAPIMESFSAAEAKAWFTVNGSAIKAQLGNAPILVLSTENAKQAIFQIAKSMQEPEHSAFGSGLAGLQTESDEDACATARTLYLKGNSLAEPYRGYMARLLLTGKDGHQKP
ncbi:hypothetical protein [Paraburkholderia nemoris]|uniref:hypothetical protein n=1 Tax=Paraburkholderia nemoris TaxID=2793076 RepID=UPI001F18EA3F|nr:MULTISPECIES: hypothetical protein [Paraburkholderia]